MTSGINAMRVWQVKPTERTSHAFAARTRAIAYVVNKTKRLFSTNLGETPSGNRRKA